MKNGRRLSISMHAPAQGVKQHASRNNMHRGPSCESGVLDSSLQHERSSRPSPNVIWWERQPLGRDGA